jgi:transposase
MAINDWLTPQAAPLQPSFLTSRAAGAVLPDYFTQSAEIAKTRLGIAGQEQSLRLAEEEAALKRAGREASASLLPRISELDVNDPEYYSKLYGLVSEPGMANALTDRSMSEFLGLQQRARGEITDRQRFEETRRAQEESALAAENRAIQREERQRARQSATGLQDLIEKFGLELEDVGFATKYRKDLEKFDQLDDASRADFIDQVQLDYSQKALARKLSKAGIKPSMKEWEEAQVEETPGGPKRFSANMVDAIVADIQRRDDDRRFRLALAGRAPGITATPQELADYEELKKLTGGGAGAAAKYIPGAGGNGIATSAE